MADYKRIIDVSACQGKIDWSKVDVDAVIIRAGYGRLVSQKDKYFDQNYQEAKSRGIPVGVYWYSYAMNEEEARMEADACLQIIEGGQYEYPIYYDVEEDKQFALGKTAVSKIIRAFLSKVEGAGYWVGLYGSYSSLTTYTDEDIRERYAVWLAHWGVSKSPYKGSYGLWQTGVGLISGITGDVDIDRGYVDYPTLIKNAGLNGFMKQSEPQEVQKLASTVITVECPYAMPATTIKKGDKGIGVQWLQFNLKTLGYDIGKYGIDGDFGSATDAALRKFQQDNKLEADGLCGPKTKAVINLKIYVMPQWKASQFIPRLTRPEAGNKYYITKSKGGWSTAIKGSPTDKDCDVLANCVGYAFGRFNEIAGNEAMALLLPINAENFIEVAKQQGLEISQTPKVGSVMCWQKGATLSNSDGAGHVAVVEQVISATEVVTSESGYGCANPFWTQNRKKGSGNWGAGNGYTFRGFILNPAVK